MNDCRKDATIIGWDDALNEHICANCEVIEVWCRRKIKGYPPFSMGSQNFTKGIEGSDNCGVSIITHLQRKIDIKTYEVLQ